MDDLARQLLDLMGGRLLDPLEILLDDPLTDLREQCKLAAGSLAGRLLSPDDKVATHAVARVVGALYSGDDEFDPPADWWRTPLGRIVLIRVGHPYTETVSYAVAGAMLGVTRQGVHDLVTRNKLTRHPDGGVTVTSIRERIQLRGQK